LRDKDERERRWRREREIERKEICFWNSLKVKNIILMIYKRLREFIVRCI
jgi:hypothetical protein